jgi:glycosyltransferase involved in cell wall biosynthesis
VVGDADRRPHAAPPRPGDAHQLYDIDCDSPVSFVILDFCLRSLMGHPYEYDRAVAEAAAGRGWNRVSVVADRAVDEAIRHALRALPHFGIDLDGNYAGRFTGYLPRRQWLGLNMRLHHRYLLRELRRLPADLFDPDGPNLVLVPTLRHSQITAFVKWAEEVNRVRPVHFCLVFHFTGFPDFTPETYTGDGYRAALRYLERSRVADRFHLFADTRELVREYAAYTRLPVELIPIPHAPPETPDRVPDGPPRVVYLGDARTNKGYHLLGDLFSALAESGRHPFRAEIQANVRIASEWEVLRSKWLMARLPQVRLHHDPLSSADYYALLARADLVIAPYTTAYYHSQTSGVVLEAAAAGKPVITPRGTWGTSYLRSIGGGCATFLPEDPTSLFEATAAALGDLPALTAAARAAVGRCRAFHNADNYVDLLTRKVKPT